jgi:predicted N-acetyltransferase YhbS
VEIATEGRGQAAGIAALFAAAFTASAGAEEGALIGDLARRMLADTPEADLRIFTAREGGALLGAILFSRLAYAGEPRVVFILSPVAVAPGRQGEGIGSALIAYGLDMLRQEGVDIAVTYGDPAFYGRLGFAPADVAQVPAPFDLQQPEGWQALSLTGAPVAPLAGRPACVPALADPVYW